MQSTEVRTDDVPHLVSNGALINVSPVDGAFQSQVDLDDGVSFQPVVANNTLYLLTDAGRLIAYR